MKSGEKVKLSELTTEERLANIRNLLSARLAVPPDETRFLLAQYDEVLNRNGVLLGQVESANEEAEELRARFAELRSESVGQSFERELTVD